MRSRLTVPARAALLVAVAVLVACEDDPSGPEPTAVTSGTIGGLPFTVVSGTVLQFGTDGPLYADDGRIVLDDDPAGLGMSDPGLLQLRTRFALSNRGTLQIAAFGNAGAEFSSGVWIELERIGATISYDFRLAGASFADSAFSPQPQIPSSEQWVVTEFYADSVPRYAGAQSGLAMWQLNDTTPTFGEDVLGCSLGPAVDPATPTGDRVGYALVSAWILTVQARNQIVGPCQ